ncbi:hypothetical protein T492DRAFT_252602 [Pavlovales sp. CCMP2436]|nr:hypothetical protein T492DRAFT_252602 [Pavlovales sp. CCMP2436]
MSLARRQLVIPAYTPFGHRARRAGDLRRLHGRQPRLAPPRLVRYRRGATVPPKGSSTKGLGSFNHQLITAAISYDIVAPLPPRISSRSRRTLHRALQSRKYSSLFTHHHPHRHLNYWATLVA